MNYSGIIENDIANGPGIRTSLFVSGCRNNCPGCFNKEEQDFNYGNKFTDEVSEYIINSVEDNFHEGITILGGDPLEPENADVLVNFIYKFREKYGNTKTVWLYTGYIYEDIINKNDNRSKLINMVDVLVDGPFKIDLKDLRLKFKGSSNQRIIDIKATKNDRFHTPVIIG